jgi:glycosyltransferase involved in cell wall biosynthesis
VSAVPRLSIGLPVFNGEGYLAESIEALLGQSYEDFELIISDNASTDSTPGICHHYEKRDSRIRYVRQPLNIGLVPNHNFVVGQARGELFKWASHDDLYARDLLKRCIDVLDDYPQAVLAQSWSAIIDSSGTATKLIKYPSATASSRAPERFRSMLFDGKGDYTYAVMRTNVLRRTSLHASYHFADRTLITELALHGPFYQVADWLYFRRDRPEQPRLTVRDRCAIFDPRRADRLRNPAIRLYAEYIWGYLSAIRRAPLSPADRRECYVCLMRWLASRAVPAREPLGQPMSSAQQPVLYLARWLASLALPGRDVRVGEQPPAERPDISINALVPDHDRRPA